MAQVSLFVQREGSAKFRGVDEANDQALLSEIEGTRPLRNLWADTAATGVNLATGTNVTALQLGSAATTVTVPGALSVAGTTTTISTTHLLVNDVLTLFANGAATGDEAGIAFERGSSGDDAIFFWNEANQRFEFGLFDTVGGTVAPTGALSSPNLKAVACSEVAMIGPDPILSSNGGMTIATSSALLRLRATGANPIKLETNGFDVDLDVTAQGQVELSDPDATNAAKLHLLNAAGEARIILDASNGHFESNNHLGSQGAQFYGDGNGAQIRATGAGDPVIFIPNANGLAANENVQVYHGYMSPRGAGASDLGSTSQEWGDAYLTSSLYIGAAQECRVGNVGNNLILQASGGYALPNAVNAVALGSTTLPFSSGVFGTVTSETVTITDDGTYGSVTASPNPLLLGGGGTLGIAALGFSGSNNFGVRSDAQIGWSSTTNAAAGNDAGFKRSAAGQVDLYSPSGAADGVLRLLDAAGNPDGLVYASGNSLQLDAPSGSILLKTGGTSRWTLDAAGRLYPSTGNTYDLGGTTGTIQDIYLGTGRLWLGTSQTSSIRDVSGAVRVTDALQIGSATGMTATSDDGDVFAGGSVYNWQWDASSGNWYFYSSAAQTSITALILGTAGTNHGFRTDSTGIFGWTSTTGNANSNPDLALSRGSTGILQISDPGGVADGGIWLKDAAGNTDAIFTINSGAPFINAPNGGIQRFSISGTTRFIISAGYVGPGSPGSGDLGATSNPWDALILGDATAQVELGHDGTNDGRLIVNDPNGATDARIYVKSTAGAGDIILAASNAGTYGAVFAGSGAELRLGSNNGSLWEISTGGNLYPLNGAVTPVDIGTVTAPIDGLILGDATAQVELTHNGANDGRVHVKDPNGVVGGHVRVEDSTGAGGGYISATSATLFDIQTAAGGSTIRMGILGNTRLNIDSSGVFAGYAGEPFGTAALNWGTTRIGGTAESAHLVFESNSELLTGLSGASVSTTNLVPAGARLLFVTTRVTTAVTTSSGTNTYLIGDGSDVDRYGTGISGALNNTSDHTDATADPMSWSASTQDVTLTPPGAETFTAGAVRVVAHYVIASAPTS